MADPRCDLSIYLVTDTAMCGTFGVVATVAAAVAAGVTVVQLRDPAASDDDLVRLGRAVAAELRGTGCPLIVDDRVHLVAAIGANGAHVGQGDLPPGQARRLLGPEAVLGLSVQTPAQVAAAAADDLAAIDYLGVGPVWAQDTKPDAAAPIGPAGLRAVVAASPWPCVAIGGVGAARAAAVRAAGAAGMAVVSAICGQPSVATAVRQLADAWHAAEGAAR